MASTTSGRWNGLKNRFTILPVFIRRTHRIVAALWILSLALTAAVPAAGEALPGPSIPGLTFIATIITGSYLLIRPWIRKDSTVSDRLKRLENWNVSRPVIIRRTHRIFATLLLIFIGIALALEATGGTETPLVITPIIGFLLILVITGGYMLLRPWINRIRTS